MTSANDLNEQWLSHAEWVVSSDDVTGTSTIEERKSHHHTFFKHFYWFKYYSARSTTGCPSPLQNAPALNSAPPSAGRSFRVGCSVAHVPLLFVKCPAEPTASGWRRPSPEFHIAMDCSEANLLQREKKPSYLRNDDTRSVPSAVNQQPLRGKQERADNGNFVGLLMFPHNHTTTNV